MVSRIQNRGNDYTDNLFSNKFSENSAVGSIEGATALKINENVNQNENFIEKEEQALNLKNFESKEEPANQFHLKNDIDSISGISMENASYIEDNSNENLIKDESTEEAVPKIFSEELSDNESQRNDLGEEPINQNLFDQEASDEEEDFEIPAFLRKQKF